MLFPTADTLIVTNDHNAIEPNGQSGNYDNFYACQLPRFMRAKQVVNSHDYKHL